jgi:hypothetical protein
MSVSGCGFPRVPLSQVLCAAFFGHLIPAASEAQADTVRGGLRAHPFSVSAEYRVHKRDHAIVFGRYLDMARDTLVLGHDYGRGLVPASKVARADISAIEVRNGSHSIRGLMIGGGVGVGLGWILGSLVGGIGELAQRDVQRGFAVSFGGVGALVGLVMGHQSERWKRVPWP